MRLSARAGLALLVVLGPAFLVGACGGGGDPEGDPAAATAPAGNGDGELPADQTVPIGHTVWYAGFEVEFVEATLTAAQDEFTEEIAYLLAVAARFTNLGSGPASFSHGVAVVSGAESFPARFDSDLQAVPSGLSGEGTLAFEVTEGFDLDPAYLQIGGAGEVQARVPVGPAGGELVDLAPSEAAVDAEISLELVDIALTGAELRADLPASHSALPEGERVLTLHLTATSRKSGNWRINPQDFALTLPDGNSVGVDGAELASLPGNDGGVQTPDLWLQFRVAEATAGEYALRFAPGSYWIEDGPAEGSVTFPLP